ncbi:MAG: hypothetical protein LBB26_02290 [Puniceicoccales bacterium]|nr:hypothetical protein [Puniceicoccales bacterium]
MSIAVVTTWGVSEGTLRCSAPTAHSGLSGASFYDSSGNPCEGGTDPLEEQLKAVAEKAVVAHLGANASSAAMVYLVREKKYVDLARKINRGLTGDYRSTFQCLICPNLAFVTHEMPALPKSGFWQVVGKSGDGGFSLAAISLGSMFTCLLTALFSGTAPNWVGVGVSLLVLILGLFIGATGQFACRRAVSET